MFITHIKYSQYGGTPREWELVDFMPGQINLMVGKNATGKTRSLNLIGTLAHLLSGERNELPEHVDYEVHFREEDENELLYRLSIRKHQVKEERLERDGKMLFMRSNSSDCQLFFEELNQYLHVSVPENVLAVVARRDKTQHSYFEKLYKWGKGTLHYRFGTLLGKNYGMIIMPEEKHHSGSSDEEIDLHKTERVVENWSTWSRPPSYRQLLACELLLVRKQ